MKNPSCVLLNRRNANGSSSARFPPYPRKKTVPGLGRYENNQSVLKTFTAEACDNPPEANVKISPVTGSRSATRRVAVYCDTTRTKTGRATWYSALIRGMRENADRSPVPRRVNCDDWYVPLIRNRSLGRRSSDAL